MKTSTLLLLGAAGVAAYFLFAKRASAQETAYASSGGIPVIATRNGATTATTAQTIPEGIAAVNQAIRSGAQLSSYSRTLSRNVSATVGGRTLSGNVAILGGQSKPSFVAVTQPARDSRGLTATDRRILANRGVAATTENARSYGLI